MQNIGIILAYAFIALLILTVLEKCRSSSVRYETLGTEINAAEQCREISSEADRIKAAGEAEAARVQAIGYTINPFGALLNPKNYATVNEQAQSIRNITGVDISNEQISNINSSCVNAVDTIQTNTIDNSKCKICETQKCVLKGAKQVNKSDLTAKCVAQGVVDILMTGDASAKNVAAATAVQDAVGTTATNRAALQGCSISTTNIDNQQLINAVQTCANNAKQLQKNELIWCGDASDVIQENEKKSVLDCLVSAAVLTQADIATQQVNDTKMDTQQKAEGGITSLASFGSSGVLCVAVVVAGLVGYKFFSSKSESRSYYE